MRMRMGWRWRKAEVEVVEGCVAAVAAEITRGIETERETGGGAGRWCGGGEVSGGRASPELVRRRNGVDSGDALVTGSKNGVVEVGKGEPLGHRRPELSAAGVAA